VELAPLFSGQGLALARRTFASFGGADQLALGVPWWWWLPKVMTAIPFTR